MDSIIIVSDIAGNFDTLQALLAQTPEGYLVSVGDLIDRGQKSRQVLEFFEQNIKAGTGTALLGNHELMMIDSLKHNWWQNWLRNGGRATLNSFSEEGNDGCHAARKMVPFLESLPLSFRQEGLYVSHAPYGGYPETERESFVWNRRAPIEIEGTFCVFGHNWNGVKYYKNDAGEDFAVCIDTAGSEILTALHWPTKAIYQQKVIDPQ